MMQYNSIERTLIVSAIADLIYNDRACSENGVSLQKLYKALSMLGCNVTKKFIEETAEDECARGCITIMDNGCYSLGPKYNESNTELYEKNNMGSSNNSSAGSSPMRMKREMAIRVGERRKRAKKVFDPSENNLPSKRKRGRPMGSLNKTTIKKQSQNSKSSQRKSESSNEDETNDNTHLEITNKATGGVCSVCRQYRSKIDSDKLIGCRDCSNKAHPSCLQGDEMLRLRPDNSWQCPHCKTCVVCVETKDAGELTICTVCSDAYHSSCHTPEIPDRIMGSQWECRNCSAVKNCQNIDNSYSDKLPSSDRSSKLSDRSDSMNYSIERKKDKANRSDDKSVKNKSKEYSPNAVHKENSKWQYNQQTASPIRQTVYEDDDQEINIDIETVDVKRNLNNPSSTFMTKHDLNKLQASSIYQKHPNFTPSNDVDVSIPDASVWTQNHVYEYFLSYFPEQAHIFRDQEIDGKSLLIMRRTDVINRLGLPLGPALKIYRHVVRLQARKDDITMCWL